MGKVSREQYEQSDAVLSACQRYRYLLFRRWRGTGTTMWIIGLNPSTADAEQDDPTIRRCVGFAKRCGCVALYMGNLFGWRATDPAHLKRVSNPVGPDNNDYLVDMASQSKWIVAAWGANPIATPRGEEVQRLLRGREIYCLGTTAAGAPRHPLYLRREAPLVRWCSGESDG